jgi:hypothetical protein
MDPMGWDISISHEEIVQYGKLEKNTRNSPEKKTTTHGKQHRKLNKKMCCFPHVTGFRFKV